MNLKTEFKKHMQSCPPELTWESKQGVKEYLQRRTKQDPYFAVVTGSLHAGQITYDKQQKFVEKIMRHKQKHGIKTLLNENEVRNTLQGAQLWEGKAKHLVKSTQCYIDHCGYQGRDCLTKPKAREGLVGCMQSAQTKIKNELLKEHPEWNKKEHPGDHMTLIQKKIQSAGFGQKTSDLVREYLGDEQAVAVDRHVGDYICKKRGFCPLMKKGGKFKFEKERDIPPHIYRQISQQVRHVAKQCRKTPADIQVPSWLRGVCDSRLYQRPGPTNIFIGEGKYVNCKARPK